MRETLIKRVISWNIDPCATAASDFYSATKFPKFTISTFARSFVRIE